MAVGLWTVCLAATVSFLLWNLVHFVRNLQAARSTGLPYVCMPVRETNPIWYLSQPFHRPIVSILPKRLVSSWAWIRFWYMDWRFVAKYSNHARLGDVFLIVSPGGLSVEIADARVVGDVLSRSRGGFVKPTWIYEGVNIFGVNVVTTEGHVWRRHRKVVGSQFNEVIHGQVWFEALSLVNAVLGRWASPSSPSSSSPVVEDISPDLTTLGLSVIIAAGFGVPISFQGHNDDHPHERPGPSGLDADRVAQFPRSFEYLVTHIIRLVAIPNFLLRLGPASWRTLAASFHEVGDMLREMMDFEVKLQKSPSALLKQNHPKQSILGEVVRSGGLLHDDLGKPDLKDKPDHISTAVLSKQEVLGNTFILALAGSRTTSETLVYSLTLLAMHPDIQNWVIQDIDQAVAEEDENPLNWQYQTLFPKLIAPLCVMMETQRIYPSVLVVPKWNPDSPQRLAIEGRQVLLPAKTMAIFSLMGLHLNAKYWGPNPAEYRPQNWDKRCELRWPLVTSEHEHGAVSSDQGSTTEHLVAGGIRAPLEGAYMAFGLGARSCLGKRFAQVEFVAVLTMVLRSYRVELALRDGETWRDARVRADETLEGSLCMPTLMLQKNVPLKLVKR